MKLSAKNLQAVVKIMSPWDLPDGVMVGWVERAENEDAYRVTVYREARADERPRRFVTRLATITGMELVCVASDPKQLMDLLRKKIQAVALELAPPEPEPEPVVEESRVIVRKVFECGHCAAHVSPSQPICDHCGGHLAPVDGPHRLKSGAALGALGSGAALRALHQSGVITTESLFAGIAGGALGRFSGGRR